MIGRGGVITGYGIAVPDNVVTNDDLSKIALSHFPRLRQTVVDDAKAGITRAQKIKRIAEKK